MKICVPLAIAAVVLPPLSDNCIFSFQSSRYLRARVSSKGRGGFYGVRLLLVLLPPFLLLDM